MNDPQFVVGITDPFCHCVEDDRGVSIGRFLEEKERTKEFDITESPYLTLARFFSLSVAAADGQVERIKSSVSPPHARHSREKQVLFCEGRTVTSR